MLTSHRRRYADWIARKSLVVKLILLIAALVLFRLGQIVAAAAQDIGREQAGAFLITGLIAIVLVVLALYTIYLVLRSAIRDIRTQETDDDVSTTE